MITSGAFAPILTSTSNYYTPGSKRKYTNLLRDTVFGKLQRRPLPSGLNVVSPYITEPSLSKKLTGKRSELVGLYSAKRLEDAGFKHGTYVVGVGL